MNLFITILIIIALSLGLVALIPLLSIGIALLFIVGAFLIWLLPIMIIASSDVTTGGEKLCWILAIIFLSWFAWIFYFFLAPLKPRTSCSTYRHYRY
tara:strand:- start:111288 stop:111578 length:291 start_codon:yes stop_codon:yes gene_type:complete